uniref:Uncharacterized protein LOC100183527 n=1 Tax=Phallusia mammillata TaxID=59560 RepID=A0A6F9DIJ5_9ASCI|nr:uncharacterized protein LOC100183527 [Phallusia mammillata]
MNKIKVNLWSVILLWSVSVCQVQSYVSLKASEQVSAIYQQDAYLMCGVDSDRLISQVVWYRDANTDPTPIYYYIPPRYNNPSKEYKDRLSLDDDYSSLILKSVKLEDELWYKCRVMVVTNQSLGIGDGFPEESSVTMQLTVNVPPKDVKLTTFHSGKNLTLTCRSTRSKPQANIRWIVFQNGKSREVKPNKVISDFTGLVADTIGYLYWTIRSNENGTTFQCVVDHPETVTTLRRNITLVAPKLLHPIPMRFDWLGDTVDYSTHTNDASLEKNATTLPGLVKMLVAPSKVVLVNSSVVISVSAEGAFPEPSYTWWGEDLDTTYGKFLRITNLEKSRVYFCLVENPVGRVVMSVELTASATDPADESTADPRIGSSDDEIMTSGAVVAAIAFGGLAIIFLLGFMIYYFAFKRPSDRKNDGGDVAGSDDFVEKPKPLYAASESPQDLRVKSTQPVGVNGSRDTDSLLKSAAPPVSRYSNGSTPEKKRFDSGSMGSAATTTSGYSDQLNGKLPSDIPLTPDSAPEGKERAITKHLQDFDENASFLGEYGSTFGLDTAGSPKLVEVEARVSPFDEPHDYQAESDDASSVDSGASGHEGRYTLPHGESWEHIDPTKVVHTPV